MAPAVCGEPVAAQPAGPDASGEFRSLDQEVQALKKEVVELNKDLFVLEEELLFPANTQVAVFVSLDVGELLRASTRSRSRSTTRKSRIISTPRARPRR